MEGIRRRSRQVYLEKRKPKKLEEIRDYIEDEQFLLDGIKVTEAETRAFRYKKRIYELVNKPPIEIDNLIEYRMPEAYDEKGCVSQKKRFAVNTQPSSNQTCDERMSQVTWEESRLRNATWEYGSKNKRQRSHDYKFVFEDPHRQLDFIKTSIINGDKVDDSPRKLPGGYRDKPILKMLQKERKTLPIYNYREQVLRAVQENQVVVIVGETGSGKTTEIPQYLHEAGYTKHGKDCTSEKTVLKYMTDGMVLREMLSDPKLESYSVLMVDEAHERTLSTDILLGIFKDLVRLRSDLKLLISSATLDAEKFSAYFNFAPILRVPGRRYPVEIHYTKAPESNYIDAAIVTTLEIHATQASGDILVFLTGQEEIETVEEILKERIRKLGTKIGELIVCPVYANLPTELQAKIFVPTPDGARKVVLATNIAETSLTIDGIKYVVDSGYSKMKWYNPKTGMESLLVYPISKASAMQRAGRSGRTGPGKCFRLYTINSYQEDMEDNTVPEIQRTNLANVILILKNLGIDDLLNFDFLDSPPQELLRKALELLYALGALNQVGELTKVGRQMAEFPLDPMLSKMIVASDKFKCSNEIITIAALLSVGNSVFYRPKNKKFLADNARMNFYQGDAGDHIALLNVYNCWKENDYSKQWCYDNFIQFRSMKHARDIRDQLTCLVERVGIELTSSLCNLEAMKKAIISGFFLHSQAAEKWIILDSKTSTESSCTSEFRWLVVPEEKILIVRCCSIYRSLSITKPDCVNILDLFVHQPTFACVDARFWLSSFYDQGLCSINFTTTRISPRKASSPKVPAHTDSKGSASRMAYSWTSRIFLLLFPCYLALTGDTCSQNSATKHLLIMSGLTEVFPSNTGPPVSGVGSSVGTSARRMSPQTTSTSGSSSEEGPSGSEDTLSEDQGGDSGEGSSPGAPRPEGRSTVGGRASSRDYAIDYMTCTTTFNELDDLRL
ncbi:hypothetical protein CICLE_v10023841mg, partial [Citrus x clementina]